MGRVGSGVEARASSIRIKFVLDGETIKERLTVNGKSMPPTPANLKYAHRQAAEIQRRIELGSFQIADFFPDSRRAKTAAPTTFGNLADLWLQSKANLAPGTVAHYTSGVRIWKRILGEHTRMEKLTHPIIAAAIGGHPWASAKHANNTLVVLRGVMGLHYHGRHAVDNPMQGIENFAVVKKLPDPLTLDERDAILVDMHQRYDIRVWAYFQFAFYTGMSPEEIIALQWGDYDNNTQQMHVQRVRTFKGSEREGSKTHTTRDVDLVAPAIEALKAMRAVTFMKSDYIFENPATNRPWHDERLQRDSWWKPTLKRLGIRARRAYATRHTYATGALMAGVNPAYIAAQLGHANTQMLFTKYAKWIEAADKGAQRRAMEAAMSGDSSRESPKGRLGRS